MHPPYWWTRTQETSVRASIGGCVAATALVLAVVGPGVAAPDHSDHLAQRAEELAPHLEPLPAPSGCLELADTGASCGSLGVVQSPAGIVVSPDGRDVYVTGFANDTVQHLVRDRADGSLVAKECYSYDVLADCTVVRAIDGPIGLDLAADGLRLYVTGSLSHSVATFSVGSDGALTQLAGEDGCMDEEADQGCADGKELDGVSDVVVSPDRTSAYAVAPTSGALIRYGVNANGSLDSVSAAAGCFSDTGASGCSRLPIADGLSHVDMLGPKMVVAAGRNAVVAFVRNSLNGALVKPSTDRCLDADGTAGCGTVPGLRGVGGLAVASGRAFVTGRSVDQVTAIQVASDGDLTPQGCVSASGSTGCGIAFALDAPAGLTVTGGQAYVASANSSSLTTYDVGPDGLTAGRRPGTCFVRTGVTVPSGCQSALGLEGALGVASSNDGSSIYLIGNGRSTLASFDRDHAPTCTAAKVQAVRKVPVPIPLSCSDADGDPLTLAIVDKPAHATLSKVNQIKDRVRFTSKGTFTGTVTFTYRAATDAAMSAPATITVRIRKAG